MNTLPPSAQPILWPFLLRFSEPLGGPLAVMTSTFEELLDASWCSFRVKILEVRHPLPPLMRKKQHAGIWTWWVPSSETVLYPEGHRVQVPAAGDWGCIVWCLSMFVLFSISLLGDYIIQIDSSNPVSMIILWASGEPMVLNNNCWTTIVCIHIIIHICYGCLLSSYMSTHSWWIFHCLC